MMKKIIPLVAFLLTLSPRASAVPACQGDPVACWLFDASIAWREPYAIKGAPKLGLPSETSDEHRARRILIAEASWSAVNAEPPLPMGGATDAENRKRAALFVLSIMNYESSYHLFVQKYHCRGLDPAYCDGGHAWCLGQVHAEESAEMKARGWRGADLDADLVKCARAVVATLAGWAKTCPGGKGADRFAGYAMGTCGVSPKVRIRWAPAEKWWKEHAAP